MAYRISIVLVVLIFLLNCTKSSTEPIENIALATPAILYVALKNLPNSGDLQTSINTMDWEGQSHKELFSVRDGYLLDPSYSADAEQIVFVMHSDSMGAGEGIYTIDSNGENLSRLTSRDSTITYSVPQYTPNKSKVVYRSRITGQDFQIQSLDINSGLSTILVPLTFDSEKPLLTLDGNYVIYNHPIGGVHKVDMSASIDIRIADVGYSSQIQMSADTSSIYFVGRLPNLNFDMFQVDLEGNSLERVTGRDDLSNAFFRISPDGAKIINLTTSPAGNGFDIMNRDGSDWRSYSINKTAWTSFEFFPNSEEIIFTVDNDPDQNDHDHIYKIDVTGENMKRLSLSVYEESSFACFKPAQ